MTRVIYYKVLLHYAQFIFADKEKSKKMAQQRKGKKNLQQFLWEGGPFRVAIIVAKSQYLGTKHFQVKFTWIHQASFCFLVPKTSLTQPFIRHANKK